MNRTTARIAALAAVTALALAGCGALTEEEPVTAPTIEQEAAETTEPADAPAVAEEATEEAPATEAAGPGVYQAELMSGGTATLAVPGEAPADLEEFREATGQDPVGYLIVEVDNTEGTSEAMIFEASIVDADGKTYTYEDVTTATMDWDPSMAHWDEQEQLWEKYHYGTLPSAKNTVALIGPEVPETVVSVFVDYEQAERVGDL